MVKFQLLKQVSLILQKILGFLIVGKLITIPIPKHTQLLFAKSILLMFLYQMDQLLLQIFLAQILPNGSNFSLKLYNVLYLPTFKLNIFFVHLLICNSNCTLTFLESICHIQEVTSLKMIRLARLLNGLYYIENPLPKVSSNFATFTVKNSISSFDTWHYRFGHPSNKVLDQLSDQLCNIFPYVKYDNKHICYSFHYAKQCNLLFP